MRRIILIILSAAIFSVIKAEDLKGKVFDTTTSEPILSVAVTIAELNWVSYTNEAGEFLIREVKPGTYSLKLSRIGYGEYFTTINFPECGELLIGIERRTYKIGGYTVSGYKVKERETPVTFSSLDSAELNEFNFGQDLPMLLNEMTNVYSYSDAGNGFGYSYLKVRGFDQKRIGVMVNGIPLNDPEDHQVYWVDLPDLAESVEEIQFQRGVGSTLYGISTFGGSLNLITGNVGRDNDLELFTALGSYNTRKTGIKLARVITEKYRFNLRLSHIRSDGYRKNTGSEMSSYYAGFSRVGARSLTELNFYGGIEQVNAGWYASWEGDLQKDHQHNPIVYEDEIDNFFQPHFELHHSYMINEKFDFKNSIFYIFGDGFYKQYKENRDLWEYGLSSEPDAAESDLIRKKIVCKNQYGWIGQLRLKHNRSELILGSYLSLFDSDHYGRVMNLIDMEIEDFMKGQKYYNYEGNRKNFTLFANEIYKPVDDLSIMLNLHYQHLNVKFDQLEAGNFKGALLNSYEVNYNFFNPRFGVNYNINKALNIYASVSRSHREPTDSELYDTWDGPDDLGVQPLFAQADTIFATNGDVLRVKWKDPYVQEEKLTDYEIGLGYSNHILQAKINAFWMDFENEIVAYGRVDDEGSPIRGNADASIHRGIELSTAVRISEHFALTGNFSYNDIYFKDFIQYEYDEDWNPVEVDYSGNTIAGFPDIVSGVKLICTDQDWKISTQGQFIGQQYLDNTENEGRVVESYFLWNAVLEYKMDKLLGLADLAINFQVNNILNKQYETAGYYNSWDEPGNPAGNYYWPGAERNFMVGIRAQF